jgi:hypothetical protein
VGENLIDHVGVGIMWEPTDRLQEETARFEDERPAFIGQVSVRARSSHCEAGVWGTFLFPALDPGYVISAVVFAMKPRARPGGWRCRATIRRPPWPSTTVSSPSRPTSTS